MDESFRSSEPWDQKGNFPTLKHFLNLHHTHTHTHVNMHTLRTSLLPDVDPSCESHVQMANECAPARCVHVREWKSEQNAARDEEMGGARSEVKRTEVCHQRDNSQSAGRWPLYFKI